MMPASFGAIEQMIDDTDSSVTANSHRAPSGENYIANVYERPFIATDMVYRPDLDIQTSYMSRDTNFFYFQINLKDVEETTKALKGEYGIEFETTFDLRGDYYVVAPAPTSTEWGQEGAVIYKDSNEDVGGLHPVYADTHPGNGFDQQIFPTGPAPDPDAVWTRISSSSPLTVEFAVKRSAIGDPSAFIWSLWADDGLRDPAKKDYNDTFTITQAGSSILGNTDYPLKALEKLDSTCRMNNAFVPTYEDSGLCNQPAQPTATNVPPTAILPGTIKGKAFWDNNGNAKLDPGEPGAVTFITLSKGACPGSGGISTKSWTDGTFGFLNQDPGKYCVTVNTAYSVSTPRSYSVTLESGGTISVKFGLEPIP